MDTLNKKLPVSDTTATPSTSSTASVKHRDIYGLALKERDTIQVYDGNNNSPFYQKWLSAVIIKLRKDGKVSIYFTDNRIHELNMYHYQNNGRVAIDEIKDAKIKRTAAEEKRIKLEREKTVADDKALLKKLKFPLRAIIPCRLTKMTRVTESPSHTVLDINTTHVSLKLEKSKMGTSILTIPVDDIYCPADKNVHEIYLQLKEYEIQIFENPAHDVAEWEIPDLDNYLQKAIFFIVRDIINRRFTSLHNYMKKHHACLEIIIKIITKDSFFFMRENGPSDLFRKTLVSLSKKRDETLFPGLPKIERLVKTWDRLRPMTRDFNDNQIWVREKKDELFRKPQYQMSHPEPDSSCSLFFMNVAHSFSAKNNHFRYGLHHHNIPRQNAPQPVEYMKGFPDSLDDFRDGYLPARHPGHCTKFCGQSNMGRNCFYDEMKVSEPPMWRAYAMNNDESVHEYNRKKKWAERAEVAIEVCKKLWFLENYNKITEIPVGLSLHYEPLTAMRKIIHSATEKRLSTIPYSALKREGVFYWPHMLWGKKELPSRIKIQPSPEELGITVHSYDGWINAKNIRPMIQNQDFVITAIYLSGSHDRYFFSTTILAGECDSEDTTMNKDAFGDRKELNELFRFIQHTYKNKYPRDKDSIFKHRLHGDEMIMAAARRLSKIITECDHIPKRRLDVVNSLTEFLLILRIIPNLQPIPCSKVDAEREKDGPIMKRIKEIQAMPGGICRANVTHQDRDQDFGMMPSKCEHEIINLVQEVICPPNVIPLYPEPPLLKSQNPHTSNEMFLHPPQSVPMYGQSSPNLQFQSPLLTSTEVVPSYQYIADRAQLLPSQQSVTFPVSPIIINSPSVTDSTIRISNSHLQSHTSNSQLPQPSEQNGIESVPSISRTESNNVPVRKRSRSLSQQISPTVSRNSNSLKIKRKKFTRINNKRINLSLI